MSKLKLKKAESTELRSKNKTDESHLNCDTKQSNFFTNIDSNVNLENRSLQCHIINNGGEQTSKYFKRDIQAIRCDDLDESDNFVSRKITKKLTSAPCKSTKKRKKCLKNQRDIRSMTKNSNDLLKYTQDFKTVCNKGGVDVDPEQLQLAIALSQSLQDYEQNTNLTCATAKEKENIETTFGNTTSQEFREDKVTKIKKTLEQFGFKIKSSVCLEHTTTAKRPPRKLKRSNYPLISKSVEHKRQIITDKISEILFETNSCIQDIDNTIEKQTGYFSKCRLNYKCIINNPLVFYVPSLFTPTESKIGCLLKDWSEIPGREKSPEKELNQLDFKESVLFENHFDILLSGSVKKIVHTMEELTSLPSKSFTKSDLDDSIKCNNMEMSTVIFDDNSFSLGDVTDKNINSKSEKSANISHTTETTLPLQLEKAKNYTSSNTKCESLVKNDNNDANRCLSPDIFNDDSFYDKKVDSEHENDDISDDELPNVYLSQPHVLKKFDLLKNNLFNLDTTRVNDCSDVILIEDELPTVNNSSNNFINKEINDTNTSSNICLKNKNSTFISVNVDDDDDDLYVNGNGIVHYESYHDISMIKSDIESPQKSLCSGSYNSGNNFIDTQSPSQSGTINKSIDDREIDLTQSSNEENVEDPIENVASCSLNQLCTSNKSIDDSKIDLTQSYYEGKVASFKKVEISQESELIMSKEHSFEASTECDDVFVLSDDELDYSVNATLRKCKSSSKFSEFINDSIPDIMEEGPEISLVTHIPDVELVSEQSNNITLVQNDLSTQSLHRSVSFDTGKSIAVETQKRFSKLYRSSILDPITSSDLIDIDNYCTHRDSNANDDGDKNDDCSVTRSSLPDVHLPGIKLAKNNTETEPTQRAVSPKKTPSHNKYFMKTKNISPMADYKSMNSPSMLKELSKYGLKPLKRKRAIQILEHIYEQTHPLVDASELTNKLKRRKLNDALVKSIEHDRSINEECHNEQVKLNISEEKDDERHPNLKENINLQDQDHFIDIYKKNCDKISIKEMSCDDDLIFQSKEMSKVQGCRVPLHIVFHNYLSSRTMLRDAILKYEPVDIERIHCDLKNIGFRFKPKDLMDFFDRKCITIKTNTKNAAPKRRKKQ
ncbi:mutagen-sensitive 312 [Arctopsyche grandis]|uniref:mutagen-sensitive 312 n=1 Tax=Arctopsyche grandis TaxID=121162 RepID=UPI00406D6E55